MRPSVICNGYFYAFRPSLLRASGSPAPSFLSVLSLRNKIPAARVLRRLKLMTTFDDGHFGNQTAVHRRLSMPAGDRVINQTFALEIRQGDANNFLSPESTSRLSELEQEGARMVASHDDLIS